jgi:hypothetical protein
MFIATEVNQVLVDKKVIKVRTTRNTLFEEIYSIFFFLSGPAGSPGIDGKIFTVNLSSN